MVFRKRNFALAHKMQTANKIRLRNIAVLCRLETRKVFPIRDAFGKKPIRSKKRLESGNYHITFAGGKKKHRVFTFPSMPAFPGFVGYPRR